MKASHWILIGVAAVATWGSTAGCRKAELPVAPAARATRVRVAPVELSPASPPVRVPGVLSRATEPELAFKISGVIAEVTVRAGDRVERGQVMARLRLDEIDAQLVQARSAAEKARRDLGRVETLRAGKVTTLENLQDARTALEVADAALRIAEFNRRYAEIAAPTSGRVLRRLAEPGEWAGAGKAIVAFASDEDGWLVRAGLAERDAAQVDVGASVRVQFGEGAPLAGSVRRLAEATDAATRTTPVEIVLAAPPAGARSGSIVGVEIERRAVAARPRVPVTALIEGSGGQAGLFVVEHGDTARRVTVAIEQIDGESAWLRTALPAGAQVVVSGAEFVREGAPVEVAK